MNEYSVNYELDSFGFPRLQFGVVGGHRPTDHASLRIRISHLRRVRHRDENRTRETIYHTGRTSSCLTGLVLVARTVSRLLDKPKEAI